MNSVKDLEAAGEKAMEPAGWAYYASAADDEVTLRENQAAFGRIWLRPRVMINVSRVSVSTTLLGAPSTFPLYVTATALAKLAGIYRCTRRCIVAHSPPVLERERERESLLLRFPEHYFADPVLSREPSICHTTSAFS
jgi:hypothetical protein